MMNQSPYFDNYDVTEHHLKYRRHDVSHRSKLKRKKKQGLLRRYHHHLRKKRLRATRKKRIGALTRANKRKRKVHYKKRKTKFDSLRPQDKVPKPVEEEGSKRHHLGKQDIKCH